jgi:hypothetical protein
MAAGTGETRALRSEVGSYYAGGPWYGYSGWSDYAARNSIACTPGTLVKAKRTALPDQCPHSAEADVRPQGGSPGLDPTATLAVRRSCPLVW